ncbi:MAG: glycosyltransferase, partial [Candidatus Latescibacterota bacterium]|nr:glycosyltransferase [Candidatus Latescibacterota bacterium]
MTNPTSPPEGTPDGIYLSIVVPLFNEEESLEPLCEKIDVVLQELGRPAEVIFIDDGSTDDSYAVIEGLAPRFGWLRAVRFRRNNHKAAALATGFREARGELIVTMDADLQDDPA